MQMVSAKITEMPRWINLATASMIYILTSLHLREMEIAHPPVPTRRHIVMIPLKSRIARRRAVMAMMMAMILLKKMILGMTMMTLDMSLFLYLAPSSKLLSMTILVGRDSRSRS